MKERPKLLMSALVLLFFSLIAGGSIITGNPEEIFVWIGLGVVAFIISVIIGIKIDTKQTNKRQETIDLIKSDSDFKVTSEITSDDAKYWIGINDETELIKIINLNFNGEKNSEDLIKFSNIISVELLEDGRTVYSKSAMRTIGGAAVGGILAGGAGTVVGGLSGNTNVKDKISKIDVKLLLRDYIKNSITVTFFSEAEVEKGGFVYNVAHNTAIELVDKIKVIIDKADREYAQNQVSNSQTTNISQEIERLYDLKVKGIITEDEFQHLKEKYINKGK